MVKQHRPSIGRRIVACALYEGLTAVGRYPWLALRLQRIRRSGELIDEGTDVMIEGYPRCALSCAEAAFRLAQEPRPSRIAHHTHLPAHVIESVRRGIPTMVLIRHPDDAVVSQLIRKPEMSVRAALRGYIRFYAPLLTYADRVVVATFDEVISDFGGVIRRLNDRFGTDFAEFVHSPEHMARIEQEIAEDYQLRMMGDPERLHRTIPWPSGRRAALRPSVRDRYEAQATASLRRRAAKLFEEFTLGSA